MHTAADEIHRYLVMQDCGHRQRYEIRFGFADELHMIDEGRDVVPGANGFGRSFVGIGNADQLNSRQFPIDAGMVGPHAPDADDGCFQHGWFPRFLLTSSTTLLTSSAAYWRSAGVRRGCTGRLKTAPAAASVSVRPRFS